MEVVIDPDVRAVAEFMRSKIESRKLVGVAESLRAVASILWGHYDHVPVRGVEIRREKLLTANESPLEHMCVGDDFVGEAAKRRQKRPLSRIPHNGKYPSTA
jgi:hypothetical protein